MSRHLFDHAAAYAQIAERITTLEAGQVAVFEDRQTYEFPTNGRYEKNNRAEVQVLCDTRADSLFNAALQVVHAHLKQTLGANIDKMLADQAGQMSVVTLRAAVEAYNRVNAELNTPNAPVFSIETLTRVGSPFEQSRNLTVISGYCSVWLRREA